MSFFGGRGKKTAWNVWMTFDDVTPAFHALADKPVENDIQLELLERDL